MLIPNADGSSRRTALRQKPVGGVAVGGRDQESPPSRLMLMPATLATLPS
jgi:hypothetical protein